MSSGTRGALARHPGKCSLVRHSGTRGVFRLVPEGFIGRVWEHVSSSERAPEGGVLRAGFRKGLPEGLPGGWHRVVRLEINGWDSSFRSDRLNCSERRWPSDSKWAAKIDSLDRAEAGIDRTGRKAERCGPLDLRSMARVDRLDRTERNARAGPWWLTSGPYL